MEEQTKQYIDDLVRDLFQATSRGMGIVIGALASQLDATKMHAELQRQIANAIAVQTDPAAILLAKQALAAIEVLKERRERH